MKIETSDGAGAVRRWGLTVPRSAIVGACAVGLLLFLGAILATWTDEEYTLATTAHGVGHAYFRAIGFERQGPLYFVTLAAWRAFDTSIFFARLFSVAGIAGFLAVMATLLRRVWPSAPTLAFAAIAFNPFVIYAGVEIRLYASALLVSALLVLFFLDGFASERGSLGARVGFVVAAVAAAYLQYYLMFALVGFGAALLVYRRGALPVYFACSAIVAAAMLPLVGIVRAEIGVEAPSHLATLTALRLPIVASLNYVLPLLWARNPFERILYGLAVLLAIGSIVAAQPRFDRPTGTFAVASGAVIAIFLLVGLVGHVFVIVPRQTVVLFVPLTLGMAAFLATTRRPLAVVGVGGAYSVCAVLTLFALYGHGAKTGDWRRVGAELRQVVRGGDVVAVFDSDAALPLSRYFPGPLVRIPRIPRSDAYTAASYVIHSDAEVEAVLGPATRKHRRLWLVRNNACTYRNPDYGCVYLDRVIARDYRLASQQTFFESSIEELEPR